MPNKVITDCSWICSADGEAGRIWLELVMVLLYPDGSQGCSELLSRGHTSDHRLDYRPSIKSVCQIGRPLFLWDGPKKATARYASHHEESRTLWNPEQVVIRKSNGLPNRPRTTCVPTQGDIRNACQASLLAYLLAWSNVYDLSVFIQSVREHHGHLPEHWELETCANDQETHLPTFGYRGH